MRPHAEMGQLRGRGVRRRAPRQSGWYRGDLL